MASAFNLLTANSLVTQCPQALQDTVVAIPSRHLAFYVDPGAVVGFRSTAKSSAGHDGSQSGYTTSCSFRSRMAGRLRGGTSSCWQLFELLREGCRALSRTCRTVGCHAEDVSLQVSRISRELTIPSLSRYWRYRQADILRQRSVAGVQAANGSQPAAVSA
jgi:hypothetical protein